MVVAICADIGFACCRNRAIALSLLPRSRKSPPVHRADGNHCIGLDSPVQCRLVVSKESRLPEIVVVALVERCGTLKRNAQCGD